MMNAEVWMFVSALLLSVFSLTGPSKTDEILDLITKLQRLVKRVKFSGAKTTTVATTTTVRATTQQKTTTLPAGLVNFAKPVDPLSSDARRKYCEAAVCPEIFCNQSSVTKYGLLRKAVRIPKIYSLCRGDVKAFIAMQKWNARRAVESCCEYNSTLQSLNSPEIISCFQDMMKAEKRLKSIFWTSGMYSKECDAYVWCPEKEIISDSGPPKWRKGFPDRSQGDCIAVQYGLENQDENGIFNLNCSTSTGHVCYGSPEVVGD